MGRPADGIGRVLALATSMAKVRFVELLFLACFASAAPELSTRALARPSQVKIVTYLNDEVSHSGRLLSHIHLRGQ
jgi:hypothetical protein